MSSIHELLVGAMVRRNRPDYQRQMWAPNARLLLPEDLAQIDASVLFTSELGYSLNVPFEGFPIETALDFVRAQLATQGHLNGEGTCSQRFSP